MEKYLLIKNKFEINGNGEEKLYIQLKKTQFDQDGKKQTMI